MMKRRKVFWWISAVTGSGELSDLDGSWKHTESGSNTGSRNHECHDSTSQNAVVADSRHDGSEESGLDRSGESRLLRRDESNSFQDDDESNSMMFLRALTANDTNSSNMSITPLMRVFVEGTNGTNDTSASDTSALLKLPTTVNQIGTGCVIYVDGVCVVAGVQSERNATRARELDRPFEWTDETMPAFIGIIVILFGTTYLFFRIYHLESRSGADFSQDLMGIVFQDRSSDARSKMRKSVNQNLLGNGIPRTSRVSRRLMLDDFKIAQAKRVSMANMAMRTE